METRLSPEPQAQALAIQRGRVKKTQLVDAIAARSGLTLVESALALDALQAAVADSLCRGEEVVATGFVAFKPVLRRARAVRNPRTGEMTEVPERGAVRVTPSPALVRTVFGSNGA